MASKFVKVQNVDELQIGDRIRHVSGSYQILVVVANHDNRVIAVDTWDVTNHEEWEVAREDGTQ